MTQTKVFYVLRGRAKHGLITHRCSSPELALSSLQRFRTDGVEEITLFDLAGDPLPLADLEALVTGSAMPKAAALVDRS